SRSPATPSATATASQGPTVQLPDPTNLPGIIRTSPPWPNNTDQAAARLAALDLPPAGSLLHHHTDLLIYVNGQPATVPANVGLSSDVQSPLHTHTDKGTIHIESQDTNFQPVLGQFMDVWGVYFTKDCLGGDCASGDTKIRAYVNGQEWTGDPTQIPLNDQEVIV